MLPIEISLPERTLLDNGTMFVTLRTLDELETFWKENRDTFSYAAQGIEIDGEPTFLKDYEWVFGPSKAAVIQTVGRWKELGVDAEWLEDAEWFTQWPAELLDPELSAQAQSDVLAERLFDDWKASYTEEVECHDQRSMDAEVEYWRAVQKQGEDYYGKDNEPGRREKI